MAPDRDKVSVDLDAALIESTRSKLGAAAESDAAVVERALNVYLLCRLLDTIQRRNGLSDNEAEALAYEEFGAARREGEVAP